MPDLEHDPVALRRLIDAAGDIITVMDVGHRRRFVSAALGRVLGYDDLDGAFPSSLVHPDDRATVVAAAEHGMGREGTTLEFRVRHADGTWRWVEASSTDRRHDPHIQGFVSVIRDVTARKNAEAEIRHLTTRDLLTDLPNRAMITERLEQLAAEFQEGSPPVAVLMVDIDDLRSVNHQLGRQRGDAVLRAVARRLAELACPECTLGRYGGDEFVLLHSPAGQVSTAELARRIEAGLADPVQADGIPVPLHATVGAYETSVPGRTAQQLIAFAVAATHTVKEMKRGR